MSPPFSIPPIPADTKQAAMAAYNRDNFFLVVGDRLAELTTGVDQNGFREARMISRRERPSLVMVTIFQFIEMLSDSQAAESTRSRLDWKYALHLSLNYPGYPGDTLCKYRQWALQVPERLNALQRILSRLVEAGLISGYQGEMLSAGAVLDEVCSVTRWDRAYKAWDWRWRLSCSFPSAACWVVSSGAH